jgi:hypothetical protein
MQRFVEKEPAEAVLGTVVNDSYLNGCALIYDRKAHNINFHLILNYVSVLENTVIISRILHFVLRTDDQMLLIFVTVLY